MQRHKCMRASHLAWESENSKTVNGPMCHYPGRQIRTCASAVVGQWSSTRGARARCAGRWCATRGAVRMGRGERAKTSTETLTVFMCAVVELRSSHAATRSARESRTRGCAVRADPCHIPPASSARPSGPTKGCGTDGAIGKRQRHDPYVKCCISEKGSGT